jgi:hypothetical protein
MTVKIGYTVFIQTNYFFALASQIPFLYVGGFKYEVQQR